MIHAFTVDVEDYYSIALRDWLGRHGPPTDAVVRNTSRILDLLAGAGTKATFFVLGEVAVTFGGLVREVVAAGHEVGVHGFYHRQVFRLSPQQFRQEVGDAKKLIEDLAGRPAAGHRAAAFSIRPDTRWALEVLAELGFEYDSSIFPIAGKRYGWPGFRRDIHRRKLPNGASIIEAPLSTVRVFGRALPACGGGYLRHFPYAYTRWAIRRIRRQRPAIVYMHPYEIDLEPRHEALREAWQDSWRFRIAHALQLRKRRTVEPKLVHLLREFDFAPLGDVIARALAPPEAGGR